MRKKQILISLFLMSLLLCNCSIRENELFNDVKIPEKTFLPANIEEYGKKVATELHTTVRNLNKLGVDYSNADSSVAFKDHFFNDYYEASSIKTQEKTIKPKPMSPKIFAERLNSLTQIQIEFIDRIINEYDKSTSYPDFEERLININKDICSKVPEIQQERLFTITAILYYGFKEIRNLEEQGLMPRTPQSEMQFLRLKSASAESGGSFGGKCRQISAYVWNLAVGAIYYTGEVVAEVSTTAVAGATLLLVVLCIPGDTEDNRTMCTNKYEDCISAGGPWTRPNSGGAGQTMCNACRVYCIATGTWVCPRPL